MGKAVSKAVDFQDKTFFKAEAVTEANNRFAVDLHNELRNDHQFVDQNLFYSPSSLSIALAMTFMGARGNTAEQMAKALHWETMSQDQLHTEKQHFLNALQESNTAGNEVLVANRLFVQKNAETLPLQEFVEGTEKFYDADVAFVDYKKNAKGARKVVNNWVEKKTKQNIKNLIPEGMFNQLTRMTLVNAIYFKGNWQMQFHEESTGLHEFIVSKNERVHVRMMNLMTDFNHIEDFGKLACQVLEMPYQGKDLSMVILLPHDNYGLAELEKRLTHEKLQKAFESVTQDFHKVKVFMPRIKLTQQFLLNDILAKMGATDMFAPNADFSGITSGPEELSVSTVIHKAFVEINEKGTEAAAVTAVVGDLKGASGLRRKSPRIPIFRADHPFLFMICHKKTGGILLMGRVVKPELY